MTNPWFKVFKATLYYNGILSVIIFPVNYLYSWFLSVRLFGLTLKPKIFFSNGVFLVEIYKHKTSTAKIEKHSFLEMGRFANSKSSRIRLGKNSILTFDGHFSLGEDCFLDVRDNAKLNIKGGKSGITCSTKVITTKSIEFGKNVIISWGCYITDSKHHIPDENCSHNDMIIGDHTWISEGVTICPGVVIEKNCVIGAKSFVNKPFLEPNSFIGGIPAKLIRKR